MAIIQVKFTYDTPPKHKTIKVQHQEMGIDGKFVNKGEMEMPGIPDSWKAEVTIEVDNSWSSRVITDKFIAWFEKEFPAASNLKIKSSKNIEVVKL